MKTSAEDNAWEEKSQDITAEILAKAVMKEADLREIIEQSACSFYLGGSVISGIFHIIGYIAIGALYYNSQTSSSLTLWPILALGALIEAYRANRRLNALVELEAIAETSESLP